MPGVSPSPGKPPPSKPSPLELSIFNSQARRRSHDPTSNHSAQSLFSSHSTNSAASPPLHTTWASPEASPKPEHASGFGFASGSTHYFSGVSDESGEKRRTRERDSDQGYPGRNIVVEDDSDNVPVIQPQPPSPTSSSPNSPYSPTELLNPGRAERRRTSSLHHPRSSQAIHHPNDHLDNQSLCETHVIRHSRRRARASLRNAPIPAPSPPKCAQGPAVVCRSDVHPGPPHAN